MRFELGPGPGVGLGHVDRHEPAHLVGRRGVPLLRARLPEVVEVLLEDPLVKVRDAHVGPAPPGDEGIHIGGCGFCTGVGHGFTYRSL